MASLTVAQLIRQLKKYPQDMRVGAACHDNDATEIQGLVTGVRVIEPGEMKDHYGEVVVIEIGG